MAEFPGIPKDYLTVSFLQQLKEYIDDKAAEGGGGGGGSSGLVVNITEEEVPGEDYSLLQADKTWKEIWDAAESGASIIVHVPESEGRGIHEMYIPWRNVGKDGGEYFFTFYVGSEVYCTTDSPDGYPVELD